MVCCLLFEFSTQCFHMWGGEICYCNNVIEAQFAWQSATHNGYLDLVSITTSVEQNNVNETGGCENKLKERRFRNGGHFYSFNCDHNLNETHCDQCVISVGNTDTRWRVPDIWLVLTFKGFGAKTGELSSGAVEWTAGMVLVRRLWKLIYNPSSLPSLRNIKINQFPHCPP